MLKEFYLNRNVPSTMYHSVLVELMSTVDGKHLIDAYIGINNVQITMNDVSVYDYSKGFRNKSLIGTKEKMSIEIISSFYEYIEKQDSNDADYTFNLSLLQSITTKNLNTEELNELAFL